MRFVLFLMCRLKNFPERLKMNDNLLNNVGIIILAAGLGTRMNSEKAKVLHTVNKKPMILYVVHASQKVVGSNIIVVVGHQAEIVKKIIFDSNYNVKFALQSEQLGTGHAVMQAMPYLNDDLDEVIVLCGDVPLISAETLKKLVRVHEKNERDITIIGVKVEDPNGYGRLIIDEKGRVTKIVEERDATILQKKINTINTGIYCIKKDFLKEGLPEIRANNAQKEYYFTDIIEIANKKNKVVGLFISENQEEFIGINTFHELEMAQRAMKENNAG